MYLATLGKLDMTFLIPRVVSTRTSVGQKRDVGKLYTELLVGMWRNQHIHEQLSYIVLIICVSVVLISRRLVSVRGSTYVG